MIIFFSFVYGLLIGSFLNVVIYRLPRELSLINPSRSFCTNCKNTIDYISLIPVVGFLLQKAKCKHCGIKISWQYPLVEIFSAIISVVIVLVFGLQINSIFILLFAYLSICLLLIDAQQQLLPDKLTIPLLWLGLLFNLDNGFVYINDAIIGAVFGYMVLWSIYWLFKLITKKEAMGYGDFKLASALGAWFGYQSLNMLLLGAAILGIIFAIGAKKYNKKFAFGPFLIIMGFVLLFFPNITNLLYY